jgi:hypothetical protein
VVSATLQLADVAARGSQEQTAKAAEALVPVRLAACLRASTDLVCCTGSASGGGGGSDALAERVLGPGDVLHLPAGWVHRLRAITEVEIVEVSTPELDDVVRHADDYGRL